MDVPMPPKRRKLKNLLEAGIYALTTSLASVSISGYVLGSSVVGSEQTLHVAPWSDRGDRCG